MNHFDVLFCIFLILCALDIAHLKGVDRLITGISVYSVSVKISAMSRLNILKMSLDFISCDDLKFASITEMTVHLRDTGISA